MTADPTTLDLLTTPVRKPNPLVVAIYHAKDGWRWRLARSGRIVADSGEAYARRSNCALAITHIARAFSAGTWKWSPGSTPRPVGRPGALVT